MVTYLKLERSSEEEVTRAASKDKWDRDDIRTTWFIGDLSVVDKNYEYHDIVVPFDVVPGDKLFVVYAIYSTGDSFGWDEGACIEVFDAFKSEEKANDLYREIHKYERASFEDKIRWVREDDSGMSVRVPWSGYFESLDDYYVIERVVK